jgi:uncharacterized membrane protein YgcG
MACVSGTTTFRIQSIGTDALIADDYTKNACTAAKLLERLHDDFTKNTTSTTVPTSATAPGDASVPSFWLRTQPKVVGFALMNETSSTSNTTNRFTTIFTSQTSKDQAYRTAVHAIMNGVYQPTIDEQYYLKNPETAQTDLSTPANFKGINGLINLNNVLENLITEKVRANTKPGSAGLALKDAQHYSKRQEIKTTLEEIARRENEIYREKFLNIILVLVGVFVIGTLLSKKFYSGGGGGGGGSGGGIFGNTFTGVGLGSSSGIFSRFGGLGLGSSGRSRLSGLFSSNPYSLSTR